MDSLFSFFFFFFLTMAPQVLEKKIALLFTYRKIVIIFKSVELEHTPSSFPQSKRWSPGWSALGEITCCNLKKWKKAALVGFIHVSSLTTGSPLQKQQEKVKSSSQQLKQVCIKPDLQSSRTKCFSFREPQNRFLDLGLLLRGCRPKSRSLPGRVEVIQSVVRVCTTFWLTSTRITLTQVHRSSSWDRLFRVAFLAGVYRPGLLVWGKPTAGHRLVGAKKTDLSRRPLRPPERWCERRSQGLCCP